MTERTSSSTDGSAVPPGRQRLQKVMARAGVASRRHAEAMIAAGRVTVNGETVTSPGGLVDPATDEIAVDGEPLATDVELVYLALHKPRGYLTTVSDPFGRRSVMELVDGRGVGIFPVGRLDLDSEGLLLVTNDGELAHRLTHPSHHVEKEYEVVVEGVPGEAEVAALREGVELEDGRATALRAEIAGRRRDTSALRIVLGEGRKRQVRRMCDAVGHPVVSLLRVRVGPVELGDLASGNARPLTDDELDALRSATGLGG
jgi:23S rRNA pseudouridine2605 synthase/16S rRNA pseudouridine516 synthase